MHPVARHFAVFAAAAGLVARASAQTPELPPVEVTGSALKQPGGSAPLGLRRFSEEDIRRSGFTTVTDLLQALPEMQGFTTNSQSINGGGGGGASASLHSIGQGYTLVLLNGRRLVPATTGSTVNLNIVPLGAIERVEVLRDGASSVYGADAIAGVVNLITRQGAAEGALGLSASRPQRAGGGGWNASLAKGVGELARDGFEAFFALGADRQAALEADQRSFSRSGFIPFADAGRSLSTAFGSSYSTPGNVVLNDRTGTGAGDAIFSPAALSSGSCPGRTRLLDGLCRFDYASTVQAEPETRRTSFYGHARWQLREGLALFGETLLSDFESRARYAPEALSVYLTQALVDRYVTPALGRLGVAANDFYPVGDASGGSPTANVRLTGAGGRANAFRSGTGHWVLGVEGSSALADYTLALTHSRQRQVDRAIGGYVVLDAVDALIANGGYDPLAADGGSGAALDAAVFRGDFSTTVSTLDVARLAVSRELVALAGGSMRAAAGVEAARQRYATSVNPDSLLTGNGGGVPFDSSRRATSAFVEVVAPLHRALTLSASLRRDAVGAVTNRANVDLDGNAAPEATQGRASVATTYKLGADFRPVDGLTARASLGSGFKAPDMGDITSSLQAAGVTGLQRCPPGLPAPLAAYCKSIPYEYNVVAGGNPSAGDAALKPERSRQWTLGLRLDVSPDAGVGLDLWQVRLAQRIASVPENVAFADGARYASAFSIAPDPSTGQPSLTYASSPINIGQARYRGIDIDASARWRTPIGRLLLKAATTYMLTSDAEIVGLPGYQSSVGKVGVDGTVVFRWLAQASASLEAGRFVHTLQGRWKPSYADQVTDGQTGPDIREVGADGILGSRAAVARRVSAYTLIDWQTRLAATPACDLTLGVRNVFDRRPPFSIADVTLTGNARGFDARYTDPVGRALTLAVAYRF